MCSNAASSASWLTGFSRYANAPSAAPRRVSSSTEITCTGMWRVRGLRFRRSSTRPAVEHRQLDVEA